MSLSLTLTWNPLIRNVVGVLTIGCSRRVRLKERLTMAMLFILNRCTIYGNVARLASGSRRLRFRNFASVLRTSPLVAFLRVVAWVALRCGTRGVRGPRRGAVRVMSGQTPVKALGRTGVRLLGCNTIMMIGPFTLMDPLLVVYLGVVRIVVMKCPSMNRIGKGSA